MKIGREGNQHSGQKGVSRRDFMKFCTLVSALGLTPASASAAAASVLAPPAYVGAIVALDPNTGAVLAMASSPAFNQEQFVNGLTEKEWLVLAKNPHHPLLNRAISAEYAPGSTYKPIMALGALQDGAIQPDTKFFCPGYLQLGNRRFHCWKRGGHGHIGLHEAIVQSCDVYFYHVGLLLGVDRIAYYAKLFGLGEKTGISLSGERPGLVPTSAWKRKVFGVPWQKGETLSIVIGQGYDLATPLQMTLAYAAIANNGKLWKPYVAYRMEGGDSGAGNDVRSQLRWQIDIKPEYFQVIQQALQGVVDESKGTAHRIEQKDFTIAGKTGTAQVVGLSRANESDRQDRDNAWFVGYAPAVNARIAVASIVEHGGHGASVASPMVAQVMASYLRGGKGL